MTDCATRQTGQVDRAARIRATGRDCDTLETARLRLRRAGPEDLGALHALWNAPEVRRYLFDDVAIDETTARSVLDHAVGLADQGLGLWLCFAKDDKALVGCAALLPVSVAAEYEWRLAAFVEPLVALDPASWHRGYAAESLGAMLRHAFDTLGIERLAAVHDVPNAASRRMLERAGFVALNEVDGPRYRMRTYTLGARTWARKAG
jgi:RimJ/RimL family protein N-acetyltransferase